MTLSDHIGVGAPSDLGWGEENSDGDGIARIEKNVVQTLSNRSRNCFSKMIILKTYIL